MIVSMSDLPILYSFRRCPYAIRARLAIQVSKQPVELREVLLRDKAPDFLATSPSATVPCLKLADEVIDESLDIMQWALAQNDPRGWLNVPDEAFELLTEADGPFKSALDRTKYASRYPECDAEEQRAIAHAFLYGLNSRLHEQSWLFGQQETIADMAILPFVRQFAFIDKSRFDAEPWHDLAAWLNAFLESDLFVSVMPKYAVWQVGDAPTIFGTP